MTYLVRVESKRRVKGMKLAANIPVDASEERIAMNMALRMFASTYDLPMGAAIVKNITLEVA